MSVATAAEITLDEYLHTSYTPDCDFVDGQLEERNVGEYEHGTLQTSIAAWFFNRRAEWNIRVVTELRTRVSSTRVRIPDLCIFPHGGPVEKVRVPPPLLCIEVRSPEDGLSRTVKVFDDYLAMGVPNLWLIDPLERSAFTYSSHGLRLAEGPLLLMPGSPIYLDLPEIFSALD